MCIRDRYYDKNTLVYIKGVYSAELGYAEQRLYLKDTVIYKAYYRQVFAEWDKYYRTYPDSELDEKKMTYSDTLYRITFTKPVHIAKTSRGKYINHKIEQSLLRHIKACVKTMYAELEKEKNNH